MLKVNNLCKKFAKAKKIGTIHKSNSTSSAENSSSDAKEKHLPFELNDISFELPSGYIMGLIGDNGAGKSVTLNLILDRYIRDSGDVEILGKKSCDPNFREHVGALVGPIGIGPYNRLHKYTKRYKMFFKDWDDEKYNSLIKQFNLDDKARFYKLSDGMKIKYSLALVLSHNAKLIILDEPTINLDPASRIEMLDIFRELVVGGEVSILYSTHITSDLDKCADFITFLIDGKMQFTGEKEQMLDEHVIVSGEVDELEKVKSHFIGFKTNSFGFTGLALTADLPEGHGLVVTRPNIEDILVYYHKKEANNEN